MPRSGRSGGASGHARAATVNATAPETSELRWRDNAEVAIVNALLDGRRLLSVLLLPCIVLACAVPAVRTGSEHGTTSASISASDQVEMPAVETGAATAQQNSPKAHVYSASDVVVRLVNSDRGKDIPTFDISIHFDGHIEAYGDIVYGQRFGSVDLRVVSQIVQDADSFGMFNYASEYIVDHSPFPNLRLSIATSSGMKDIFYTPVLDEQRVQEADLVGPEFALRLFITHLMGQRVLALVGA